jgi:DNA invertase Pin-like site-specific DNA recombinase
VTSSRTRARADVIVVHTLDRLGRTVRDTLNLIHELAERGIGVRNLADPIMVDSSNPDDPMAQLAVVLLALFGQMERTYTMARAAHARAVATAKGRRIGRPVVVDPSKLAWAAHLRDTGSTIAEIVEKTAIARTSLYRHLPPQSRGRDRRRDTARGSQAREVAMAEGRPQSLAALPEHARATAMSRWKTLRPTIEDGVPLTRTAADADVGLRTAQRWLAAYRDSGLVGLRRDRGVTAALVGPIRGWSRSSRASRSDDRRRRSRTFTAGRRNSPPRTGGRRRATRRCDRSRPAWTAVWRRLRSKEPRRIAIASNSRCAGRPTVPTRSGRPTTPSWT